MEQGLWRRVCTVKTEAGGVLLLMSGLGAALSLSLSTQSKQG